jgi:hypothetical protein
LSPLEHLCIKSFLAHGHTFVLYTYEEVDNVPFGCAIEDARTILPEERVFLVGSGIHIGSACTFSDVFRYELLRARGGWWVDTDTLCLKSDIPDAPYVFAKEVEAEDIYVGGVLKAPPDSEFLSFAIARATPAREDIAFNEIGPMLVNELVRELGLEGYAWARQDLYPLGWDQVLEFFDPAQADHIEAVVASSTFAHFYSNILRLANVLKDIGPPESSYLDRLYTAYEIEFPTARRYEWAEIEPQYVFARAHWDMDEELDRLQAEVRQLRAERERSATSTSPPAGAAVTARATMAAEHANPDSLSVRRTSTPSWFLPPPIRRLREHLREIRRVAGETHQEVIDARQQTVEALATFGDRVAQLETLAQEQLAELARVAARVEELGARSQSAPTPRPPEDAPSAQATARTDSTDPLELLRDDAGHAFRAR